MKKIHNPMTKIMIVILLIYLVSAIVIVNKLDISFPVYYVVIPIFVIMLLLTIWGERKFRKEDDEFSKKIGQEYNAAQDFSNMLGKGPNKVIILTAVITIAVIGGLVALCMYSTFIGVLTVVLLLAFLLFFAIYKSNKNATVEKYISSKNETVRDMLEEIHNQILTAVPNAVAVIDDIRVCPTYLYAKDFRL